MSRKKGALIHELELQTLEAPTHLFSCEYCEIFKETYFDEHPRKIASVVLFNYTWFGEPYGPVTRMVGKSFSSEKLTMHVFPNRFTISSSLGIISNNFSKKEMQENKIRIA